MVTGLLDRGPKSDPSKVKIELQMPAAPGSSDEPAPIVIK
jgi:hypothetical protein